MKHVNSAVKLKVIVSVLFTIAMLLLIVSSLIPSKKVNPCAERDLETKTTAYHSKENVTVFVCVSNYK